MKYELKVGDRVRVKQGYRRIVKPECLRNGRVSSIDIGSNARSGFSYTVGADCIVHVDWDGGAGRFYLCYNWLELLPSQELANGI